MRKEHLRALLPRYPRQCLQIISSYRAAAAAAGDRMSGPMENFSQPTALHVM